MFNTLRNGLLVLVCLVVGIAANAQSVLYKEVQDAAKKGTEFKSFELFDIVTGSKHDVLTKETILQPKAGMIARLYDTHPAAVAVKVTNAEGKSYVLKMLRSNPLAENANMLYRDNSGDHAFFHEKGVHYQGAVDGTEKSIATMSVFANGDVMMLYANGEGNFVVGKLEDNSNNYILYNDRDFTTIPPTSCATTDDKVVGDEEPHTGDDKATADYICKKVRLYWEIDYELYFSKLASVSLTQNYVIGTFNNVQALYRNERIAVELKTIKIWTVDDGYADGSSRDALYDFTQKGNAMQNNFDGDLAMLVALDAGGLGGVAFRGQLCNRQYAYAYGDVTGSYATVPTYSWDVQMITHEIGHNIASPHTHWCGWNTGAGGTCGSIDNCVTQESGSSCSSCTMTYDHALPFNAWTGTIMSYCHLSGRGIDLANGFGPLPAAMMRDEINNSPCLQSIISAKLTSTDVCKYSGMIYINFDSTDIGTNNFGAAPYSYAWSNGGNTKDVWVNKPGSYSVTITDSNGCSGNFNVTATTSGADTCNGFTSVQDVQKQHVNMYPNPANDKVLLKFFSDASQDIVINMTDVTGRMVKQQTVKSSKGENNITLNIADVQSGMYYIVLLGSSNQYTGLKLVVE